MGGAFEFRLLNTSWISWACTGLLRYPSIPASRQSSISKSDAPAERARILGCCVGSSRARFAVRLDDGGNRARYVLQRVNHEVFKDVPAVMENVDRATRHISASLERQDIADRSRRAMMLIPTRDGSTFHVTAGGDYWRAFHFIEGATSHDVLTTHDQAYEVARAFGKFQTMLADLPEPPLHETIPRFHDGPDRFRAFMDALERDPLNRAAVAGPEIAFLLDNADTFDRLPALVSSGALPLAGNAQRLQEQQRV